MEYTPSADRYDSMLYRRCGKSGILLPAVSVGLWHNFGFLDPMENCRKILWKAFDLGITHFDLANNYGTPPGSAEENFGVIFQKDFSYYRDQLIISSKAGYLMWDGPYGNWGSRKYLVSSCDQSLKRMKLDYVDIFYSHRVDPDTPLEETMMALDYIVRSGRALYAGISNYPADLTQKASAILKSLGTPCLIHQPRYSMFDRWVENGLLDAIEKEGIGSIVFSPLAQGLLSDRYLVSIPDDSRAAKSHGFLKKDQITSEKIQKIYRLNEMAKARGQKLAQMAIAWLLKDARVTSVLVGVSSVEQLEINVEATKNISFTIEELAQIEEILAS